MSKQIQLTHTQHEELEAAVLSPQSSPRLVLRCRMVLLLAEGVSESEVSRRLDCSRATVARWRARFFDQGSPTFGADRPGRGRKRTTLTPEKVREIVELTQLEPPPLQTRWTLKSMSERAGVAPSAVRRVWKAYGLPSRQS